MLKLNAKGISHLLIPLIVVVIGVAAFGTYKLVSSSAATRGIAFPLTGKAKVNKNGTTDLIFPLRCTDTPCNVSRVTIKGHKAKAHKCRKGICAYSITSASNVSNKSFMTKVYLKGKSKPKAYNVYYKR